MSACNVGADPMGDDEGGGEADVAEPLSLAMTPQDEADGVVPADPVTVEAANGTLTEVSLVGTHGSDVEGSLDDDATSWSSEEPLGYGRTYILEATGTGEDGEAVSESAEFTTVTPDQQASVRMNTPDGGTVGVGMPISFEFDTAIIDKEAVEDAIEISSEPETEGSFYWYNDAWLMWRPKDYWEPGTEISVDAEIYGKDLGDGIYGAQDRSATMTIGEEVIARADGQSHEMRVQVNGEHQRTMPISLGEPETPTPNGIYTVMSEHYDYTMDSSTFGVPADAPDGYEITVSHATRMSHSGIFYHSAPWSVGDQGHRHVSNGCINMSTADADWMMNNSRPGDLIEVVNAGDQELAATDGWSVWQMSWEEWKSGGEHA